MYYGINFRILNLLEIVFNFIRILCVDVYRIDIIFKVLEGKLFL